MVGSAASGVLTGTGLERRVQDACIIRYVRGCPCRRALERGRECENYEAEYSYGCPRKGHSRHR